MRQIQGLDRRIREEVYNPVYGNKRGFLFSIPETAFEWVEGGFRRVVWSLTDRIIGGCL